MAKSSVLAASALAAVIFCSFYANAQGPPDDGSIAIRFPEGIDADTGCPTGWKPFQFPKKHKPTVYTIHREGDGCVLKAESIESASAIYREIDVDIREYPFLKWRWKVENIIKGGIEGTKEGDDFAARVYVTFKYEPEKSTFFERVRIRLMEKMYRIKPPGNVINYVWANRIKKGEVFSSPFTGKVKVVAVESGDELAGRWTDEQRDLYGDYRRLFKDEPPKVTGVAVMTDSDNTKERATGWYGDIIFKKKP